MLRRNVYSGAPWEKQVAYCRAKRCGNAVFVSGTTAVDEDGKVVGVDDMLAQARFILRKIGRALTECGASLHDVVRTRIFVVDIARFEAIAQAHREAFEGIDPVATCVEVARLVAPELLVEIEVDALVDDSDLA
jgi:enamine deaminase RidA (YjgF/YER057c/UK114 family)